MVHPTGIDFSARDRSRDSDREIYWEKLVYSTLTKGGLKPDTSCTCYFMTIGDGADRLGASYMDGGIGIYREAKLLRIVLSQDSNPTLDDEGMLWNVNDRMFSEIHKIILRERTSPRIGSMDPRSNPKDHDYWEHYRRYFQTRIYEKRIRGRPWSTQESLYCEFKIFSQDRLVFDWLCHYTGVARAADTQEWQLEGYHDM